MSFAAAITQSLNLLAEQFEAYYGDKAEIDQEDGVLKVDIDGIGTYLFNRHAPLQQLWLSSPRSGAWHFTHAGAGWVSTRGDKKSLYDILNAELGLMPRWGAA